MIELTLTQMAEKLRAHEISPVELVAAHLRQIEAVNPRINAFVTVIGEEAMAKAKRLESQPPEGALWGVPITVKDTFDVAGVPTRAGSRIRDTAPPPDRDCNVLAKLGPGVIVLGKTNTPEFASSYETDNFVTGRTSNPWNVDFTPGGSSGGEAAAIAACCSPGGIGSDGGGSIRVPAHFCGIAGFKPTHRRIGGGGIWPPSAPPYSLVTSPGPMARTVEDCARLFRNMIGFDPQDSLSLPVLCRIERASPKPRIGVMRAMSGVPVHADISAAVDRAAKLFADLGCEVTEFSPSGIERAPNVWALLFGELGAMQSRKLLGDRSGEAHWTLTENLRDTPPPTLEQIMDGCAERERLRASILEQMTTIDFVLSPPMSIPAFQHRQRRFDVPGRNIGLFAAAAVSVIWNLFGFPALVLPMDHTAEGLPVGVQIAGKPFTDEAVLDAGIDLERARGPYRLLLH